MRLMVRGGVAVALTGVVSITGSGIASAEESRLKEERREVLAVGQTRVVDGAVRTVKTVDSRAGALTITIPGERISATALILALCPTDALGALVVHC